uniref:Uncharacterized protein n=1 Tax=Strigamia maritima TaxID=126957 RepID=T1JJP9_STRMM
MKRKRKSQLEVCKWNLSSIELYKGRKKWLRGNDSNQKFLFSVCTILKSNWLSFLQVFSRCASLSSLHLRHKQTHNNNENQVNVKMKFGSKKRKKTIPSITTVSSWMDNSILVGIQFLAG